MNKIIQIILFFFICPYQLNIKLLKFIFVLIFNQINH